MCTVSRYTFHMIKSFRDKGLRKFAETGDHRKIPVQDIARLRRTLAALDAATRPGDMDVAGFKFHALTGPLKGRYSVWLTGNYRVTFAFEGGNAVEVDIEDYH